MKQFTLEDLRALKPCHDPVKYLPENWTGNALDILNVKECPFPDRLWLLMHQEFFSEKFMRLYAVGCARQVQHLMHDERSIKALDVAEAYANGNATNAELDAARDSARAALWNTAMKVSSAVWDAEFAAARAAVWAVVWVASDIRAAANDAARAAARIVASDIRGAAWDSAWDAQEIKLREMIITGIETKDVR